MYYIFGDIHGCLNNLENVFNQIKNIITDEDKIVFLGDYIDRGEFSYEIIEFLIDISEKYNAIFLQGNHEDMLMKYKSGLFDYRIYLENGGMATLNSYRKTVGSTDIPRKHREFFENLKQHYEADNFIAVHAGFNPDIFNMEEQSSHDKLWIREKFFRSSRKWNKTVIFGHTPCSILHGKMKNVYFDSEKNIIGIDTGACYGGTLTCLRWPDKTIFQG